MLSLQLGREVTIVTTPCSSGLTMILFLCLCPPRPLSQCYHCRWDMCHLPRWTNPDSFHLHFLKLKVCSPLQMRATYTASIAGIIHMHLLSLQQLKLACATAKEGRQRSTN
ncbi:hypothetical protein GBAR_LOCUS14595 [Geodia barretti]|uniref:Uncharacterized protein n=1 Tax=Geodia barretti TaxID=519541 RepID=A0AA35S9Z2_GEOBA|nr:hypothetical protein GBAR_LOCUS14595 [Geodia barretti]